MQIVNKNSIALSLIYLAIVIITLIPFGRGNISGLEVSFPFFIFAIFFSACKKKIKCMIFRFLQTFFLHYGLYGYFVV